MSKNIFADNATQYWAVQMPVIPLRSMEKKPIPFGWQNFHDSMPDEKTRNGWLKQYPTGNIGLPLGKQSGVIALDIDTTDEELIRLIQETLPPSPWIRYGMKGKVLAYAYTGQRTFRIKASTGETICELLSEKTQVVLPPSIYPTRQTATFTKSSHCYATCPAILKTDFGRSLQTMASPSRVVAIPS